MQISALRVDVQRLSQGKQSAEARTAAAEATAQQCQQELAALRMLTASMLSQAQPPGAPPGLAFPELEGVESAKPGVTGEASNSVVDTLTQQQASRVSPHRPPSASCAIQQQQHAKHSVAQGAAQSLLKIRVVT